MSRFNPLLPLSYHTLFADGSYVRAHQHSNGNPVDFEITGSQVHDSKIAPQLIKLINEAGHFIADKGYDSEKIRNKAIEFGCNPSYQGEAIALNQTQILIHIYTRLGIL